MASSSTSDGNASRRYRARMTGSVALDRLVSEISACRICVDSPRSAPLPHAPRPVLRPSATARLCIASQAPGTRVHESGVPFTDRSGVRLRSWLGLDETTFYDQRRVAIVPMGFCFPGLDAHGGDLPPRPECALAWHRRLFAAMPQLELILVVGSHAQAWHLPSNARLGMTETVKGWRNLLAERERPRILPLPHPSWRNNAWLIRNPWFETDLLPVLRVEVQRLTGRAPPHPATPHHRGSGDA